MLRLSVLFFSVLLLSVISETVSAEGRKITKKRLDINGHEEQLKKLQSAEEHIEYFQGLGGDFILLAAYLEELSQLSSRIKETGRDAASEKPYFFNLEFLDIFLKLGKVHKNELQPKIDRYISFSQEFQLNNDYETNAIDYYRFPPRYDYVDQARDLAILSNSGNRRYNLLVSGVSRKKKIIENDYWSTNHNIGLCIVSQNQECTFNVHQHLQKIKKDEIQAILHRRVCNISIAYKDRLILADICALPF